MQKGVWRIHLWPSQAIFFQQKKRVNYSSTMDKNRATAAPNNLVASGRLTVSILQIRVVSGVGLDQHGPNLPYELQCVSHRIFQHQEFVGNYLFMLFRGCFFHLMCWVMGSEFLIAKLVYWCFVSWWCGIIFFLTPLVRLRVYYLKVIHILGKQS